MSVENVFTEAESTSSNRVEETYEDVLIVGAGPSGLQAACTAQELGLSHRIVDRRGLVHSFVDYPQTLRFFSPPDEMEVGGVPFPMRGGEKPAREDILAYFRAVAAYKKLTLSLWERIVDVRRDSDGFRVETVLEPHGDLPRIRRARAIVLASGVWDEPNRLTCAGANLPHVHYRFHEPTEYFGQKVLVVGGGNSAVHAALALSEAHAHVVMAMRRAPVAYQSHLRPFVVRDLEFAVQDGKVDLREGTVVQRVEPEQVWLQPFAYDAEHPERGAPQGEPYACPMRFVFALLGQRPDVDFFHRLGLCVEPDGRPARDPETFETNVPNIYVTGSLAGDKIDIVLTARAQTADVMKCLAARFRTA